MLVFWLCYIYPLFCAYHQRGCLLWSSVSSCVYCWVELRTVRLPERETGSPQAELAWRGVLFGQHTYFSFLFNLNVFRLVMHFSINLVPPMFTSPHFWSLTWWACILISNPQSGSFPWRLPSKTLWFGDNLYFSIIVSSLLLLSPRVHFHFFLAFCALLNVFIWDSIL